jgi:hypothetical protein
MWVGRAEEFARPEFATSGLPTTRELGQTSVK